MKIKYYIDCLYPYSEIISKNKLPNFINLQKKLLKKLNIQKEIICDIDGDSIYPIIFLDNKSIETKKIRISKKLYRKYLKLLCEG